MSDFTRPQQHLLTHVEPGPEVTHVRDRLNVRWHRDGDYWWADIGYGYEVHHTWPGVLSREPLTDASSEAAG
ncbi:MAG TPA: hypothetical protein VK453_25535 [Micromonosporaceae bacterium]|nr:hypothetical protein [Micromonosporaceae bacterium]